MKNQPLFDKLVSRTVKTPSGCWVWQGAKTIRGYGSSWWRGKYIMTHRAIFTAVHGGELDRKTQVCHSCDNSSCINPAHLFAGSSFDNIHDMINKGRHSHGAEHAEAIKRGWTPEKRAKRGKQVADRFHQEHQERTLAAGVPDDWKYCPTCATWKPHSDFHLNKARYDGLHARCKLCRYPKS